MTKEKKIAFSKMTIKSVYATGELTDSESGELYEVLKRLEFCEKVLTQKNTEKAVRDDCETILDGIYESCVEMNKML
ncbi:hypothetical protein [Vibrio sp. D431a]|uniref:hypothetical protein n=1 Tax=Vibrio sp. D431a TaxID=2837388 RepID=UPI002552F9F8|nr:hypothetical protein [Vibrio sp. D431a]MDK9793303.1 hypothetical protein [Vibrio sp. D431a]